MQEDYWYIAILRFKGIPDGLSQRYESLTACGSNYFKEFKELAPKRGLEVVAEQFDISDEEGDRIKSQLRELILRLNQGESLDVQKEFDSIRRIVNFSQ